MNRIISLFWLGLLLSAIPDEASQFDLSSSWFVCVSAELKIRPRRINVAFPVTRPTLVFPADPKVFKAFHKIKILPPTPDPVIFLAKNHFLQINVFKYSSDVCLPTNC